jgi:DnaJ like chaperone protein
MKKKVLGKVVGGLLGLASGGPLGALLGLAIGHAHDERADDGTGFWNSMRMSYTGFSGNVQQAAFTMGVIVLGAKMAKADGRVTREAIEAFKRVFNVHPSQVASIGKLFDQAGQTANGYEPYAFHLAQIFKNNPAVLEEILSGLFIIAAADTGAITPAEMRFLERVGTIFDFGVDDFVRIAARAGVRIALKEKPRDESYAILGLKEDATPEQIKLAYRALIRKHHPDKLVAQGMPPEFIATANEKMKRINGAYDTICKQRGIK